MSATYLVRRILLAVPTLVLISLVGFGIQAATPGDPLLARVGREALQHMSAADIQVRRTEMGLDDPVPVRYAKWLSSLLQGDAGYSLTSGRPVVEDIGSRLGPTLLLMGSAITFSVVLGVTMGVVAAVRQHSRLDYLLTTFAMAGISIPPFVSGLFVIYLFAVSLRLLPAGGMFTLGQDFDINDRVKHLIMPALILGIANAAALMRYTRANMLEVLTRDYMTTARAKGLGPRAIFVRHGLRNALIPVITLIALQLPDLVAGALVTEQVFSWPGLGQLAVQAAIARDSSLIMGLMMVVAVFVVAASILADVAYGLVDPRIRLAGR